jgi:RNA polymerase sigma factor (sigma-70 family)
VLHCCPCGCTSAGDGGGSVTEAEVRQFEDIWRKYYALLVAWLYRRSGSLCDAQDAAQVAFVQLWRHWSRVDDPRAFLYRVAGNEVIRLSKSRSDLAASADDADRQADPQPVWYQHDADFVRDVLLALPRRQREVIACLYNGYQYLEIATTLDMPIVTVRSDRRHAKEALGPPEKWKDLDLRPRRLRHACAEMRTGNPSPPGARPLISASWVRSAEHLNPARGARVRRMPASELEDRQERSPLRAVYDTVGAAVADLASRMELMFTVCEADGAILFRDGDHRVMRRADKEGFEESAYWSEAEVGTNANGVVLKVGHAVTVSHEEHFLRDQRHWVCAAAPVHDPQNGRMIGVFNVTGGRGAAAPVMLRLIDAAAQQAERQLTRLRKCGEFPGRPQDDLKWSLPRYSP